MLNEELRRLRKERNLTQEQLAEIFGLSQSTIASWEKGTRQPVTEFIPTIAEFFGVTTDALLGMDEPANAAPPAVPRTLEARIVSGGMDQLPQEDREQILSVIRAMYSKRPELFNIGGSDDA